MALLKLVSVLLHIALHFRTPAKLLGSANNSKAIRGRLNSSSLVPNHHGFHRDRRLRQRENPAQELDGAMLREKFDAVADNSGNERIATLKDHPEPAGNWHHRV